MSKRLLWLPPILGLLVLGAMFWRIHVLAGEVDRLGRLSDSAPPTRLPEGVVPSSDAPPALPEPTVSPTVSGGPRSPP